MVLYFYLKPDRLKEINETFKDNNNYKNETTLKDYYLSTDIEYKGNILSAFKFIETKKKKTLLLDTLVIYVLKILILKKLSLWEEKDGK